jgi:hypothetical protein
MRTHRFLLVALLMLVLGGCGGDDSKGPTQSADESSGTPTPSATAAPSRKYVSSANVERLLRQIFTKGDTPASSIRCPTRVETEKGGTITCRVRFEDGTRKRFTARQVNDSGRVTFSK